MVDAFEKASGKKVPYKIVERRPGDVASCYADPTKAKEELGWVAENAKLKRVIIQTFHKGPPSQVISHVHTWFGDVAK